MPKIDKKVVIGGGLAALGLLLLGEKAKAEPPPPPPPPGLVSLYGNVTDAITASPLVGVSITLWNPDGNELLASTTTNVSGSYTLNNILPGNYLVRFEKEVYEIASNDISLVEGLNELNVQMIPLGATQFEYVSDIRQQLWEGTNNLGGLKFEVDIQNIGGAVGTVHPIATIEHSFSGSPNYIDMGQQLIPPGETTTFHGEWSLQNELGPDDWWRARSIISEAGAITFDFGLSLKLISVGVEPAGGGEYWVTQIIRVPYSDAAFSSTITIAGVTASHGELYPTQWLYPQIVITHAGEYEIRGVYEGFTSPFGHVVTVSPALLPSGTYDIIASLRYGYVVGPDEIRGWMTGWENVLVGQAVIP